MRRYIRLTMAEPESPRLYGDLAGWFHLLTAPEEYAEEAAFYVRVLRESCASPPRTVLELGSGGGNNASHMKAHFDLTLVDLSPDMVQVSRSLNPECEHAVGDMRDARLGRTFDAVFVHDALEYLTTPEDLSAAMETAFVHLAPGGAALFVPDSVRDTFEPRTEHGGHDGGDRALRYLEWTWEPGSDRHRVRGRLCLSAARRLEGPRDPRPPPLRRLPPERVDASADRRRVRIPESSRRVRRRG